MPLLRKGVLMPAKGVDFSVPSKFIDARSGFPQNMRYYRGEMRKRPGKTAYGSAVADASQIMGIGRLELNDGQKWLVRASKKKIERYNTATSLWEVISASDLTGGDGDLVNFTQVTESGLLIATNGVDNIRKWTGSGNDADLGGSPPKAKYATYLSPYLLLAHIDDGAAVNPWKIQNCDTDSPEVWTGGNTNEYLLSDEPSPIQNIAKLNEYVVAYKKESLYLGYKVDPPDIFRFDCVKTGIGLAAPRSFADAEGYHYFMGMNNFYRWNGGIPDAIGGPVLDEVFSRISRANIGRCHAIHIQELTEIWFFIVTSGYSWPREIWKYNYRFGFWYYDTCLDITAAGKWEKTSTETWDSESGTWNEALDTWDSGIAIQAWEDIVFGDVNGLVSKLDYDSANDLGVAVESWFISQDYTGDTLEFSKRWLKLDLWAKAQATGTKLYVDYSINEGDTWVNIPYTSSQSYISLGTTYVKTTLYFDIRGEQIRFRFRNAESGEIWYIQNFYPYYLVKEEGGR